MVRPLSMDQVSLVLTLIELTIRKHHPSVTYFHVVNQITYHYFHAYLRKIPNIVQCYSGPCNRKVPQ